MVFPISLLPSNERSLRQNWEPAELVRLEILLDRREALEFLQEVFQIGKVVQNVRSQHQHVILKYELVPFFMIIDIPYVQNLSYKIFVVDKVQVGELVSQHPASGSLLVFGR